ncbi:hypothetical protein [Bosea sp. (in: a-proteobacteria)]|uniref:hypothetical protein n=1 Tax=Bosea sp. (in: a-proteobacteria) TaxID=1871050 RepID=UPI0027331ABE|nr:hypothetical protein [Bosea sp. (in: a-proteobacteria)]MDP3407795.1 hypothetical protein [Bosea sp. (in: a-proteobacteria)]
MPRRRTIGIGHNGGPPLKPRKRRAATGSGAIGSTFDWRFAHRKAWRKPRDIALRREDNAQALGLTYEEYALEIMERGYYPQPEHVEAIKARRAERRRSGGVVGQSLKGRRLR